MMSRVGLFVFVGLLGAVSAACRPYIPVGDFGDGSDFSYCHEFAANELLLFWNYTATDVTFAIQARTLGYVGMGFGPSVGDDLVVAWYTPGVDGAGVYDYHDHRPATFADTVQDATVVSGSENATLGFTSVVFTRPLAATTPSEDFTLPTGEDLQLHFSYHTDDLTHGDPDSLVRHNIRNFSPDPIHLNGTEFENTGDVVCYNGHWGSSCQHSCPGIANGTVVPLFDNICSGHGVCDDGLAGSGDCTCNEVAVIIPEPTAVRQAGDGFLYYGEACDLQCAVGCGGGCDQVTGACTACQTGFWGAPACNECDFPFCSGKGLCSSDTGECVCFNGWSGKDCSVDPNADEEEDGGLSPEATANIVIAVLSLLAIVSTFVVVYKLLEDKRKRLGLPPRKGFGYTSKRNFTELSDSVADDKASEAASTATTEEEAKPAAEEAKAEDGPAKTEDGAEVI